MENLFILLISIVVFVALLVVVKVLFGKKKLLQGQQSSVNQGEKPQSSAAVTYSATLPSEDWRVELVNPDGSRLVIYPPNFSKR